MTTARSRNRQGWPHLAGAVAVFAMLAAAAGSPPPVLADAGERATVMSDGTLRVRGRDLRLFGIHIPDTGRFCDSRVRPSRCGPRAVIALDNRIRGFVYCDELGWNDDGTMAAVCYVEGRGSVLAPREDLAAWMLSNGWALALPDAPFDYIARERIARHNFRGIWGFQVDRIR